MFLRLRSSWLRNHQSLARRVIRQIYKDFVWPKATAENSFLNVRHYCLCLVRVRLRFSRRVFQSVSAAHHHSPLTLTITGLLTAHRTLPPTPNCSPHSPTSISSVSVAVSSPATVCGERSGDSECELFSVRWRWAWSVGVHLCFKILAQKNRWCYNTEPPQGKELWFLDFHWSRR